MDGFLKYVKFVMRSKGIAGVLPRAKMLMDRFDIDGRKMMDAVAGINALGAKYNFRPVMIVPAVVLNRHPGLLKYASDSSLEFAIHGYTHKSHRPWSLEMQKEEIEKAKAVFHKVKMPYCGFRAPYLSCNADTDKALEACGMKWNSDQGVMWNYRNQRSRDSYSTKEAVDILYDPQDSANTLAIPRMHGNMACIPLVLPDDEILVDRFGITDEDLITEIWSDIHEQLHARGDIFVLQLHPERFCFCEKAMDALLADIQKRGKHVWVTDMCEIARWWKERSTFGFTITAGTDGGFDVTCTCTDRASVLARNITEGGEVFRPGYQHAPSRHFQLQTNGCKPCIGIDPGCTPELHQFITELGFACETRQDGTTYAVSFEAKETYAPEREVEILTKIEKSDRPLLRFWLWPDKCESAFTTSHDLDCITLTDFVYRALGR